MDVNDIHKTSFTIIFARFVTVSYSSLVFINIDTLQHPETEHLTNMSKKQGCLY